MIHRKLIENRILKLTRTLTVVATSVCLAITFSRAEAAVVITATEVGGDVVFAGGGTLDVDALSQISDESWEAYIFPEQGDILVGSSPASFAQTFEFFSFGILSPVNFGPGNGALSPIIGDSGTGDRFGMVTITGLGPTVIVPDGYVSGAPLVGTLTFSNTDFATLGLTEGTYVWSWGSGADADTFTLIIPEPGSLALLMVGGLALVRRRDRQVLRRGARR